MKIDSFSTRLREDELSGDANDKHGKSLEWAILDKSMVLHESFWRGNLKGLMY